MKSTIIKSLFNKACFLQLVKFACVGLICTTVSYLIFIILFFTTNLNYLLESAIGYIAAIFINYKLNKTWSFQKQGKFFGKEVIKYYFLYAFSLGINLLVFFITTKILTINLLVGNAIAIAIATIVSFLGSKLLIFK